MLPLRLSPEQVRYFKHVADFHTSYLNLGPSFFVRYMITRGVSAESTKKLLQTVGVPIFYHKTEIGNRGAILKNAYCLPRHGLFVSTSKDLPLFANVGEYQ